MALQFVDIPGWLSKENILLKCSLYQKGKPYNIIYLHFWMQSILAFPWLFPFIVASAHSFSEIFHILHEQITFLHETLFINTERREQQWCDGVAKILHHRENSRYPMWWGRKTLLWLLFVLEICVCVCVDIDSMHQCMIVKLYSYFNLHFVLWSFWVVPSVGSLR